MNTDKQLLLKDLCARLPYGVKIKFNDGTDNVYNLDGNIHGRFTESVIQAIDDLELKPYLRPISSMTKKEEKEYSKYAHFGNTLGDWIKSIDYLNSIHVDYRGLIPMGLALPALDGIYNV